jgi:hypothetical protein
MELGCNAKLQEAIKTAGDRVKHYPLATAAILGARRHRQKFAAHAQFCHFGYESKQQSRTLVRKKLLLPHQKPAREEKPPQIAAIYLAYLSRSTLAVFLQHKLQTLYSTTQMDPAKHKRPSLVSVVRRSVQRTPLREALSRAIQTAREDFAIVACKT